MYGGGDGRVRGQLFPKDSLQELHRWLAWCGDWKGAVRATQNLPSKGREFSAPRICDGNGLPLLVHSHQVPNPGGHYQGKALHGSTIFGIGDSTLAHGGD
jgi:hypothetical protein